MNTPDSPIPAVIWVTGTGALLLLVVLPILAEIQRRGRHREVEARRRTVLNTLGRTVVCPVFIPAGRPENPYGTYRVGEVVGPNLVDWYGEATFDGSDTPTFDWYPRVERERNPSPATEGAGQPFLDVMYDHRAERPPTNFPL